LEEAVALFSPASASSGSDPNPLEDDDDDDGTGPPLLLLSDQLRSRDFSRSLPARQRGRASAGSLASFLSETPAPAAAASGSGSAAGRRRSAVQEDGAAGKEPPAEETGAGPGGAPPGTLFDRPDGSLHPGSTEESSGSSDGGGLDEAALRGACLRGAAERESRLLGGGEDPLLLPPPPPPALRRSVGILLPAGLALRRHASCGARLETSGGQGEEEEEGRMARASMVANLPSRRFSLAPANPLYRAPHGLQAAPAHGSENRLLPRPRRRRWTLLAWLPGRRHPPPAPGAAA
jgi:hypothetical protein